MEFFHERLTEGGAHVVGWYGWYAVRSRTNSRPATLVASGGYFGPPTADGLIEIGYSVLPEYRGQGYATELVGALISRALRLMSLGRVVTRTTVENAASIKVLERCGFRRAGTGHQPGEVRYERGLAPTD
jgi:RimJ/RimL family protein N-acetyltransferase